MKRREMAKDVFLTGNGWGDAVREPLAGDASFRHYERLNGPKGHVVLMDAPPPMENVQSFVHIARHLANLGYSAPEVHAVDQANGFLLLEDLGDDLFGRLMEKGEDPTALYRLAVDFLIDLHKSGPKAVSTRLPFYDDDKLLDEAGLLVDWYYPEITGKPPDHDLAAQYRALWEKILPHAREVRSSLVLRDFFVDNLVRLPRPGIKGCGLLDFQDAVVGPITYDLVSLLEDARRDLAPSLINEMTMRYVNAFPDLDPVAFDRSWAIMAAQRHAKVIGVFTRLYRRDGKKTYLKHIPRVWRLLERSLEHPLLAELRDWLDRVLPPDGRLEPRA